MTENLQIREREIIRCEACKRKKATRKLIIESFDGRDISMETYLCESCFEKIKNLIEKENPKLRWWR